MTKSRRPSPSRFEKLSKLFGRRRRRSQQRAKLRLESLEDRLLLTHGDFGENPSHSPNDHVHAELLIYIDGQQVNLPKDIGVNSSGIISPVHTHDADNVIHLHPVGGQSLSEHLRLGDFFDTWRTNAGTPGNNPDSVLSSTELLGEQVGGDRELRMYVNGHRTDKFEDYLVNDGDRIVLSLSDDPIVTLNTNQGPILIELFEDQTPIHVNNFLNYVNDGDYLNTIFHRKVNNFVVQGGGFETNNVNFTSTSQLTPIPTDAAVQNEPGISNDRGTVALAKVGGNPNSGTSQFFFNVDDNGDPAPDGLNHQNGGFTVFGFVLDMDTVDKIAALPTTNRGGAFNSLPLDSGELVVVQSVEGDGEVAGVVFTDTDQDGARDSGESGIANTTIYVDANNNGVLDSGELSTTTDANGNYEFVLPAGSHVIRQILPAGIVQSTPNGSHTVSVKIGRTVSNRNFGNFQLVAPTAVDLLGNSDTGSSNGDNLTRLNNSSDTNKLRFNVTGVSHGAIVKLFANGNQVGQATAAGNSVFITTLGTATLEDGTVAVTATQTKSGVVSPASPSLSVQIDTTAPTFSSTAPTEAVVDTQLTYDAATNDEAVSKPVSYSLVNAPAGASIDSVTGVVSWTPTSAQRGDHAFTVRATDAAGNVGEQSVDIEVKGTDRAAIRLEATDLSGVPISSVVIGDEFLVNVFVEDTRGTPQGVAQALMDLALLNGRVTPLSIQYSAEFSENQAGTVATQEFDQVAAGTSTAAGAGEQLMFTARLRAEALGEETLFARLPNEITDPNATPISLFNGSGQEAIPFDEITFGNVTIQTVTAFVGTPDEIPAVDEDSQNVPLNVLANDSFRAGKSGTLRISGASQGSDGGTVTVAADGKSLIYTPAANFFGTETLTYQLTDDATGTVTVDVTVDVLPENDPPTVLDDNFPGVNEDSAQRILDVLKNDSFAPDSTETLTITAISNISNGGNVTIGPAGGHILYSPAQHFFGTETFEYTVSDGKGGEATGTVTVEVLPVNDPPRAFNDQLTVAEDSQDHTVDVLANDNAGPNETDDLTIAQVGTPSQGGTVTIAGDKKTVVYTPAPNFFGQETFTYVVDDGNAQIQAIVVVTVTPVNDQPTATADDFTFTKNTGPHLLDVMDNDSIAPDEGETLTLTGVSSGSAGGTLAVKNGQVEYTPVAEFTGEETFTYTISDGNGGTATGNVTVLVRDFIPSTLSGVVFIDADRNGVRDASELPVAGSMISLTGTDDFGQEVNLSTVTNGQGAYQFTELAPGTYQVRQTQPMALVNGKTMAGTAGGTVSAPNQIDVTLAEDTTAEGYNFGEHGRRPHLISIRERFASAAQLKTTVIVEPQPAPPIIIGHDGWQAFSNTDITVNGGTTVDVDTIEQGNPVQFTIDLADRMRAQSQALPDGFHVFRFSGPEQFRNGTAASQAAQHDDHDHGDHDHGGHGDAEGEFGSASANVATAIDHHMAHTEDHRLQQFSLPMVDDPHDDEERRQRFARTVDLLFASDLAGN